jgi:tRNA pseudouridine38-40 synthase
MCRRATRRLDITHVATTRLDIEYDGGGFRGWAAQPGQRTVQGELEAALATVLRERVELSVAGRTDAGVHALGQVASFRSGSEPGANLARSLNGILPDDIAVRSAAPATDGFDARRDAHSRTYCYRVLIRSVPSPFEQGRSLWWPRRIDREVLDKCAMALAGNHDFTAFTPTDSDHVRFERQILRAEWQWEGDPPAADESEQARITGRLRLPGGASDDDDLGRAPSEQSTRAEGVLCFWVEADAFMRNMVRVLVGTMLEVGGGGRTVDEFTALLQGAQRELAGETAPAHGLYLASVRY